MNKYLLVPSVVQGLLNIFFLVILSSVSVFRMLLKRMFCRLHVMDGLSSNLIVPCKCYYVPISIAIL